MNEDSGLLKIIEGIAGVLDRNLNPPALGLNGVSLPEISVFGLAYPKYDSDGNAFPVVPNESLTDEINLLPNDLLPGFCFFDYADPTTVHVGGNRSNPRLTTPLSIIFFVDFKRLKGMTKWIGDYRLFREQFKGAITSILTNKMTALGGTLTLNKIIDKGIDDVFSGYKMNLDRMQFYQQPYYAVRFECELNFMQKVLC